MILSLGKKKTSETPYSFRDRFKDIERISIIYPQDEKWFRIARYSLPILFHNGELFQYQLLMDPTVEQPISGDRFQFAEMDYSPKAERAQRIASSIMSFNPSCLFQLEPFPRPALQNLVGALNVSLKIGFGEETSGLNIVFSQKPTGFYERNLLNLMSLFSVET